MKRILIDARSWAWGGHGTYLRGLCDELDNINDLEIILIILPKDLPDIRQYKRLKLVAAKARIYSVQEQLILPLLLRRLRPDLVHFTHFNVPILYTGKFVLTFHDLTITRYLVRHTNPLLQLKFLAKFAVQKFVMKVAVARALKIIVPANYVKEDIAKTFKNTSEKIITIHEGPGRSYHSTAGMKVSAIKGPYILYIGILFRHKNLACLIRAFGRVSKRFPNLSLVIAGQGAELPYLKKLAGNLRVIFTGFVSDQALQTLLKGASVFVFPSLSEGFGLPPLEAMRAQIPVVAARATTLPEVLGEAAIYFDPTDEQDMADKILNVVTDQNLAANLKARGRRQVKKYSWTKMADETAALYRKLA